MITRTVKIGDHVHRAETWNPTRDASGKHIRYVDLSSLDNVEKRIVGHQNILANDAPSRARQLIQTGDILVSTVRPNLNGVARVPKELDGSTASTGFCILRPNKARLLPEYLFHWVQNSIFIADMMRKETGASYPAVSDRIIFDSEIPLPPLDEQQRIATILDQADNLRRKRRLAIDKLDGLTQAIFLEMFGDPIKNDRVWPMGKLEDFTASFEGGRNLVADDIENPAAAYRVLKISGIGRYGYDFKETKALPEDYVPPQSHFIKNGDLLISRANTKELVGRVAFVHFTPENIILPDKIWRFVWKTPFLVNTTFVEHMFRHPSMRQTLEKLATGTSGSMKNISQEKMFAIRTIIPPLPLQNTFAERMHQITDISKKQHASAQNLESLFSSFQHAAFNGEILRDKALLKVLAYA